RQRQQQGAAHAKKSQVQWVGRILAHLGAAPRRGFLVVVVFLIVGGPAAGFGRRTPHGLRPGGGRGLFNGFDNLLLDGRWRGDADLGLAFGAAAALAGEPVRNAQRATAFGVGAGNADRHGGGLGKVSRVWASAVCLIIAQEPARSKGPPKKD